MLTGPVPITSANLVISPTLFADEAKEKAVFLKLFTENIATIKETVYEKAGIVIDDTLFIQSITNDPDTVQVEYREFGPNHAIKLPSWTASTQDSAHVELSGTLAESDIPIRIKIKLNDPEYAPGYEYDTVLWLSKSVLR